MTEEKQYITYHIPNASGGVNMRELFNENHDPATGQFSEGGGSSNGNSGGSRPSSKAGELGGSRSHTWISPAGSKATLHINDETKQEEINLDGDNHTVSHLDQSAYLSITGVDNTQLLDKGPVNIKEINGKPTAIYEIHAGPNAGKQAGIVIPTEVYKDYTTFHETKTALIKKQAQWDREKSDADERARRDINARSGLTPSGKE